MVGLRLHPSLAQRTGEFGDPTRRAGRRGEEWVGHSGRLRGPYRLFIEPNDAVAGHPDALFQFHHQPVTYFAPYAEGKAARAEHLKDIEDFLAALRAGNLPAVAFVKPIGAYNEHMGYADLLGGQQYVANLVKAVQDSAIWKDSVIIITYDEAGGRWDHVPPPRGDRWGPGVRVPAIIISPYAKRRFVDHTTYETTSILKFIETRWQLAPLGSRDAAANNLFNAFDFSQTP